MKSSSTWMRWGAVFFSAATMLTSVALIGTSGWLISAAALMPPILTLEVAIVGVRFFGLSRAVFRWLERVTSHEVALAGTTQLRVRLWDAASILGPRGIWRLRGSDSLDRLTRDTELLQDQVTRVRTPYLAAAVSSVALIVFTIFVLPLSGLFLFLSLLVSGLVVPLLALQIERRVALRALSVRNEIASTVSDAAIRAAEFRVLGAADVVMRRLADQDARRVKAESTAAKLGAATSALNGLATGTTVFASLLAATSSYYNGRLDGQMIAVLCLIPWSAGEVFNSFGQAIAAKARVELAQQRTDEILNAAAAQLAKAHAPRERFLASPAVLDIDRVSVSWGSSPVVLDVSMTIRRGERVAVVGPTGCGKSTLAAAVLRLVEHEGTVSLDSIPAERLIDYRTHVTALLQVSHVFHSTLAANLRLAAPDAEDQKLTWVLQRVGLGDWLAGLPKGLETVLGDGGLPMSGGEVQRLGIARVLLSDAAFVVLDEPTEHLDPTTAAAIWQTINRLLTDRGLLIISHDPEIALDCDQVMVMADGKVAEHGAPDDLDPSGWFHQSALLAD